MYIGDIGIKGLHHLVYEVIKIHSIDQLTGRCKNIDVFIHEDNSITVRVGWKGYSYRLSREEKRSALEVVMTVLHAGGKFDKDCV